MNKELREKIIETIQKDYADVEVYVDYRDFENIESLVMDCETKDDFTNEIVNCYQETVWDYQNVIVKEIVEKFNISADDYDEVLDLVYEYAEVYVDVNQFLKREVKVNVMAQFYDDETTDFTGTGWLRWLMNSQGYKMNDYPVMKSLAEYRHLVPSKRYPGFWEDENETEWAKKQCAIINNGEDKFLKSTLREICELPIDYMRSLTFLTRMTIEHYYNIKSGNFNFITFNKNTMCGLFDCWNGSGSLLEIELNKDVKINKKNIYQVQLEYNGRSKKKPFIGYTVDEVYGLVGSCWDGNYCLNW